MKISYSAILLLIIISCSSNHDNGKSTNLINQKLDTIEVEHNECTDCLDVLVLKGKITIPDSVKSNYPFPVRDILITGRYSFKDIFEDKGDSRFMLIGYFNKIGYKVGYGKSPEFFVMNYKKI